MEPAIELDGLERRYGERVALAGVTLSVPAGATLALLGGNGAGKTTLLRVLAGLLRPHGGRALVLGATLPQERWKLPGRVGYLGHEPLLYRELSGRENLTTTPPCTAGPALASRRCWPRWGWRTAPTSRCASCPRAWSSASRWRAPSCTIPKLLLLDEPRANLDPAAAERLEPLIGRASGRTRVLVSHDMEGALAEADLALGLKGGRPAAANRELYR